MEEWFLVIGIASFGWVSIRTGWRLAEWLYKQRTEVVGPSEEAILVEVERHASEELYAVDPALAIELGYAPPERPVVQPTWREQDRAAYKRQLQQYIGGIVQGSYQQNLAPGLSQLMGQAMQQQRQGTPPMCNCIGQAMHPCLGDRLCPYTKIGGTRQ